MKTLESWALHAYADGELDASGRAEIERLVEDNPAARAELLAWQQQKAALKATFDKVLDEPVPGHLLKALHAKPMRRMSHLTAVAASLLLLLLGGMAGWFAAQMPYQASRSTLADGAITAHGIYSAEVRHPVEVVAAEKDHLQSWLSKRVGVPFRIPDLSEQGYTLLGGRLLAIGQKPAAQLMYEEAHSKRRITLYVSSYPDSDEQSFRVENRNSLTACYWRDGKLGLVVAGDMSEPDMMTLARAIYEKFENEG